MVLQVYHGSLSPSGHRPCQVDQSAGLAVTGHDEISEWWDRLAQTGCLHFQPLDMVSADLVGGLPVGGGKCKLSHQLVQLALDVKNQILDFLAQRSSPTKSQYRLKFINLPNRFGAQVVFGDTPAADELCIPVVSRARIPVG